MNSISFMIAYFYRPAIFLLALAAKAIAQRQTLDAERAFIESSSNGFWFTVIFIIVAVMLAGFVIWRKLMKPRNTSQFDFENRLRSGEGSYEDEDKDVDLMEELEWFRKAKGTKIKVRERRSTAQSKARSSAASNNGAAMTFGSSDFQEKMRQMKFAQLPIHSFLELTKGRSFGQLPLSSEPALLSAIEQASDEFEEDESVRELAIKILAAFKYRNSVESLSQLALYDLSSNLRSKCVTILTEFDHESVFETILLACADPTREVRAAAARGLFRLNFDRAEAWKRLIDTGDEFRMRQAARAAIESGIAVKSFDRLLHDDLKIAYEAFSLVALLISAGEIGPIIDAIGNNQNDRLRLALLHVVGLVNNDEILGALRSLRAEGNLSPEVATRVDEIVSAAATVTA